jgi:putative membrane protein
MWWWPGGPGGWGWIAMTISMLLFWGVLVLGGIALVRVLNRPSSRPESPLPSTPEQVLADRFARGEIGEDEYRARLGVLSSAPAAHGSRPGSRP